MAGDLVIIISCVAAFVIGALVHRWWATVPVGLVWVVLVGLSLARPDLTSEARNTNFFAFVAFEVPTLIFVMAGVALGRIAFRANSGEAS